MAQVLKQYFEDNAVQILEGQITPEMLSESVKQMFTASQITNAADEEDLTVVDNLLKLQIKTIIQMIIVERLVNIFVRI